MTPFNEFITDLAAEARAEGAEAVAELDAVGVRHAIPASR